MTDETATTVTTLIAMAQTKIAGTTVQTVGGRDLHAFLEVGRDFNTWIKERIAAYGFTEGVDYVTDLLPNFGEKGQGRPTKEYHLSLDMGKELAMVERNEKGREARRYFIECERIAKEAPDPMRALNDPVAMRGLLLSYSEKVLELQERNATLVPKAEALDRIATAEGSLNVTEAAKALQVRPKDLFSFLSQHGWIYRRTGSQQGYLGYQSKVAAGLVEHKVTTVLRADGSEKITEQVRLTPKGLSKLAALMPARLTQVAA